MIDNSLKFEIDASGNYIGTPTGSVRALSDYTNVIK